MQFKNLKTNFLGKTNYYYETIDSTQDEIWKLIENKSIKNGTLIIADVQTKGRGTHGRKWYTDEKNNIAFSFFIEMNCNVNQLNGLTKKIAEIIINVFENKYGVRLEIKEPNDIYFNGKKIGGILTETKILSEKVKYLVIGIGINTNKENFPDDIKNVATSIKKEFGIIVDTEEFITEFCNKFETQIMKGRKL